MSFRIRPLLLVAALLAGVYTALPAFAQGPPPPPPPSLDPQQLLDVMERTDERIQDARELLASTPNGQAGNEVDQAVSLQQQARRAYGEQRYAVCGRAAHEARLHVDRAISLLRGLPDPGRVSEQLERTREVLDRARDRVAHCDLPAARDLLRTALDMQRRADQAWREARYLAALQLTTSARERAMRALEACRAGEQAEDMLANALQRTDEVLSRVRDALASGGSERARQLLANAESLQSRARSEQQAGHDRLALRLTRTAREQAERALRSEGGGPGTGRGRRRG